MVVTPGRKSGTASTRLATCVCLSAFVAPLLLGKQSLLRCCLLFSELMAGYCSPSVETHGKADGGYSVKDFKVKTAGLEEELK
ncbi:hypothetical protein GN958_ATG19464 [Phytophthora infestans]|uniref:Uncharacterized protein n=1 Tax=Phytophthora infestans TaxID=4787 RepID=A0A8S9TXK8_PHYIN|nr:hypothetical protein GN958_ATG19464 [Phytophthora infestans]